MSKKFLHRMAAALAALGFVAWAFTQNFVLGLLIGAPLALAASIVFIGEKVTGSDFEHEDHTRY